MVLVGGVDGGALLGPETVRKLACDAAVIPAVLAADGHILDLAGRGALFTTAQVHGALATRPALHLPRLPDPRHLVRRPPHPALGSTADPPT